MTSIKEIHELIFNHMIEKYYKEKEAGRNFFFTIKPANRYQIPYFLEDQIKEEELLRVSLYADWQRASITYLLITEREQVFLIGELDERYENEVQDVSYNLYKYYSNSLNNLKFIHGQSLSGSFQYVLEIQRLPKNPYPTLINKIDYYLNEIHPEIEQRLAPIKQSKWDYYFLDEKKFKDYLQSEPFYESPTTSYKSDLALKSLVVKNFNGIKESILDGLPNSAKWIFLTGENGYGKTSVLQAIAAGLYGNFDESNTPLLPDNAYVSVEYYSSGKIVENSSDNTRQKSIKTKLSAELATYGSSRLQPSGTVTKELIDQQLPATRSLFSSNSMLLNIEQRLKDSFAYDRADFDQIVDCFRKLLPRLADINVKIESRIPQIYYYEKDDDGNTLTNGLTFSQLSAGFKSTITMIGDMIYRLSTRQEVASFSDLQGIVIIDEIELHLHVKLQRELPKTLSQLFPNIQFIASTHSPIPLLGAPKESIVLTVHRTEEAGITVERLDVDFSKLLPNSILTSPIFGFDDIIPESAPSIAEVETEDNYDEALATERLKKKLKILKAKLNDD